MIRIMRKIILIFYFSDNNREMIEFLIRPLSNNYRRLYKLFEQVTDRNIGEIPLLPVTVPDDLLFDSLAIHSLQLERGLLHKLVLCRRHGEHNQGKRLRPRRRKRGWNIEIEREFGEKRPKGIGNVRH
jgi:hypothetical protein